MRIDGSEMVRKNGVFRNAEDAEVLVPFQKRNKGSFLPRIQGSWNPIKGNVSKNELSKLRPATFDKLIGMEGDGRRAFNYQLFKVRAVIDEHGPQFVHDWLI
jgi:hypothetical protein